MPDYLVTLESFRGPLDLLLYLVKRNEVDIFDIPIAKIAEQFVEFMNVAQQIDVELAGDFLVMAGTLMEIKSRMLLPHDPAAAPDEEDPRLELVKQLVEYRKFKDAATLLEGRAEEQTSRLTRDALDEPLTPGGPRPLRPVELWDLVSAFNRLIRDAEALQQQPVIVDDTPQHVYQQQIRRQLEQEGRCTFRALFQAPFNRSRLVGLFLALLEMIRINQLQIEQEERFGEIWVSLKEGAPPLPEPAVEEPSENG
ncbi:MAG TPA: segregation/condensation protein A [Gemmataceae bacterium]|nr:segregation/condensation protein A [Gemmataceae bacterium]